MCDSSLTLNEDQKDCLQELMNISYGASTAAIAKIIDKYATLSIPCIKTLTSSEFKRYFKKMFDKYETYYVTNQKIDGKLNGENMFIMDEKSVINLASEFDLEEDEINEDELKDIILEITNIISSTTLSKLAGLLHASVIFSPPSVRKINSPDTFEDRYKTEYKHVIIISTEIKFENQNIFGELILMSKEESIVYLKNALDKILEEY
ncbi:MAG: chemotaxis protein CheX [Halarcobacter sp.]